MGFLSYCARILQFAQAMENLLQQFLDGRSDYIGRDRGLETANHLALAVDEELSEIPLDVVIFVHSLAKLGRRGNRQVLDLVPFVGRDGHFVLEELEKRIRTFAVHVDFLESRESGVVGERAELVDFIVAPFGLFQELVAREIENLETLGAVVIVELLQSVVLRRKATTRSCIDDQKYFALVVGERRFDTFIVENDEIKEVHRHLTVFFSTYIIYRKKQIPRKQKIPAKKQGLFKP